MHHISSHHFEQFDLWEKKGYTCLLIPHRKEIYRISVHPYAWIADLHYRIRIIWETLTFSYLKTFSHFEIQFYKNIKAELMELQDFRRENYSKKVPIHNEGKNKPGEDFTYEANRSIKKNFENFYKKFHNTYTDYLSMSSGFILHVPYDIDVPVSLLEKYYKAISGMEK